MCSSGRAFAALASSKYRSTRPEIFRGSSSECGRLTVEKVDLLWRKLSWGRDRVWKGRVPLGLIIAQQSSWSL